MLVALLPFCNAALFLCPGLSINFDKLQIDIDVAPDTTQSRLELNRVVSLRVESVTPTVPRAAPDEPSPAPTVVATVDNVPVTVENLPKLPSLDALKKFIAGSVGSSSEAAHAALNRKTRAHDVSVEDQIAKKRMR